MKADIEKLIKTSKPDTKIDKRFALKLRAQLLGNTSFQSSELGILDQIINSFKYMTNMYKYAGAVAVVVLAVAAGVYATQKQGNIKLAFAPEITGVGASAFGSLVSQDGKGSVLQGAPVAEDSSNSADQSSAMELSRVTSSIAPVAGYGGGGGVSTGMVGEKMIWPGPAPIAYKYTGDEFTLENSTVNVMRRVKGYQASQNLANMIGSMNLGIINLKAFSQTQVQNINLVEDKDFGYYININLYDGTISLNENWERWDNLNTKCGSDQRCYDDNRLKLSDVPSDDELIRISNDFLQERGIGTDTYGTAEVINDWRMWLDQQPAEYQYITETITVRYPLIINNEVVYDQSGTPYGLSVSVNVRYKRVSSIWGLSSQQYEASEYEAITDVDKIIAYAEAGGMTGPVYYEVDGATNAAYENIELGTPEYVLIQLYNYQDNKSNELLVPALRFPIVNQPKDNSYYWRTSVVVPLAKELMNDYALPEPRPMPVDDPVLMQGAESSVPEEVPLPPEGADMVEVEK